MYQGSKNTLSGVKLKFLRSVAHVLEKMNEGHRDLLKKLLILLLIILAAYIAYRLAYYVAPFIIAYILSSLIEPVVRFFVKKVKIPRRLATVISLLLVFGIVGTGIG